MIRPTFILLTVFSFISPAIGQQVCTDGFAGTYPCSQIDLQSVLTPGEIGGGGLNDIWGWTDPETGREYAIVGRTNGTSFVDVTSALNPQYLGNMPTQTRSTVWRDMKVYKNHAFVVADNAGPHGMQVFDLTRLRNSSNGSTFGPDVVYHGIESAHNVGINEESGFAYIVGSAQCAGGLHMVDISSPLSPTFAGCFDEDGYTHDVQCVNYAGPDPDYLGREICFASNATTVTIVDVTDKSAPELIFKIGYPGSGYVHQGWLTGDQQYFIQNDELDELNNATNTKTIIWDVKDLDSPEILTTFTGESRAIDHNLYIDGRFVFQSNYTSGLRILDIADIGNPVEIAYFDTHPETNSPSFSGSWSNYPYFASGNIAVTSRDEGLFIVKPTLVLAPASVVGLSAQLIADEGVKISWQTQREIDVESFDVQLQTAGGIFLSLATVEASGNSSTDQFYDALVGQTEAGPQVFRILIRDAANEEFYSDTVTLFVPVTGSHELFPAFPNPAGSRSRIALIVSEEQHVVISVYDATGREKVVLSDSKLSPDTRHTFLVDASPLPAGTYFVRARGETFDSTRTLTVVK